MIFFAVTVKRQDSFDPLSADQSTIRHRLRNLIKRRPPQEVLVKKGIYKTGRIVNIFLEFLSICMKIIKQGI